MDKIETERLLLRRITTADAEFIFQLMNEPDWIRFIGDRGIDSISSAQKYIADNFIASYRDNGFGLLAIERKPDSELVGLCGLVNRPGLSGIDIGFALLRDHVGNGYVTEAAQVTLSYAKLTLGLDRVVAITAPDNDRSVKVIENLGMKFENCIQLSPDGEELLQFAIYF